MKKVLLIVLITITAVLFWSPWMGEDGGKDIITKLSQESDIQTEIRQLTNQHSYNAETNPNGCDGLTSNWAPFGRKVNYCQYGSWYITFWGQRF